MSPLIRVEDTKPILTVPLLSQFFRIIKTLITYWISHLYLPSVIVAELQRHLSNMNMIQRMYSYFCKIRIDALMKGALMTPVPDVVWWLALVLNSLRPRQNGRHFADDTFKRIFLNENVLISIKISLKFVPKGPIDNIPALVQIMAWRRPGDKPLSEPRVVSLPTHICVTPPQWVKGWVGTRSNDYRILTSMSLMKWNSVQKDPFQNDTYYLAP